MFADAFAIFSELNVELFRLKEAGVRASQHSAINMANNGYGSTSSTLKVVRYGLLLPGNVITYVYIYIYNCDRGDVLQ